MTEAYLVYPHQLSEEIAIQDAVRCVVLVEEPLLFKQFAFHKKKLIFHRASMKAFAHRLEKQGFAVIYLDSHTIDQTQDVARILKQHKIARVHIFDLTDDWLEKRVNEALLSEKIEITWHTSPGFYLSKKEIEEEFQGRGPFVMAPFYIRQRKRLDILLDHGKPQGGKWSLDAENRKKIPKGLKTPAPLPINTNAFIKEAIVYVEEHYRKNYGSPDNFYYPVTHDEASAWLNIFLEERFSLFGPYQDAIVASESLLFHSLLSPLLNVGLLTPRFVVAKTLAWAKTTNTPLNCIEGFIRQIIGWREFVRGIYSRLGGKERSINFWGHTRALPRSFWDGSTGVEPLDNVIKKVLKTGYANHIERLMVMANFMLLAEIHPDDVYRWFMELFIDAYDWVMVPNVYGMGEYADGGMMSTKPYLSGSNYILKMSDYSNGPWVKIWDSLYWNFIDNHRKFFEMNPRCQTMLLSLNKMSQEKLNEHKKRARQFLSSL